MTSDVEEHPPLKTSQPTRRQRNGRSRRGSRDCVVCVTNGVASAGSSGQSARVPKGNIQKTRIRSPYTSKSLSGTDFFPDSGMFDPAQCLAERIHSGRSYFIPPEPLGYRTPPFPAMNPAAGARSIDGRPVTSHGPSPSNSFSPMSVLLKYSDADLNRVIPPEWPASWREPQCSISTPPMDDSLGSTDLRFSLTPPLLRGVTGDRRAAPGSPSAACRREGERRSPRRTAARPTRSARPAQLSIGESGRTLRTGAGRP